jgi:hypothetical protein
MAYTLSKRASGASNLTAKNRVWDFFGNSNRTRPANRREPLKLRRKNRPTTTKTASGIPVWPSRDPIEEEGGVNLYGFVFNSSIVWIDIMGREPYNPGGVSSPPSGSRPIGEPATDLERQRQKEWEDAVKKAWDDAHYEDSRPTQQVGGNIYKRCGNVYSRITNPADNQSSQGCLEKCQSAIGSRHHYVIDDKGTAHGYPHDAINEPTVATNHDSRRVVAAILIPQTSSCRDFWECLRNKLKENRGYSTFTNNCQTNLRDMVEECGGKYESHEDERKK